MNLNKLILIKKYHKEVLLKDFFRQGLDLKYLEQNNNEVHGFLV